MVGGGGIESPWGIVCGSPAFWTIHAVMLGFLMVAAWSAQAYLIARHEIKNIVRFDYVHGDIRWNKRAGWLYPSKRSLAQIAPAHCFALTCSLLRCHSRIHGGRAVSWNVWYWRVSVFVLVKN